MLSLTDNFLYVIDSDGRQVLFDTDKLKSALQDAFEASGNPNSYLAEDIACAVEAAMMESSRPDRIFTQSEVDGAINRILENAGCANVAQLYRRANSHLYITVDVNYEDTSNLISRHLGVDKSLADQLAMKVVDALSKLNIASASPALYLELARHYEHHCPIAAEGTANAALSAAGEVAELTGKAASGSRILLTTKETAQFMPEAGKYLLDDKILQMGNVSRLYPNFRLGLNLALLAEKLDLQAPVTDLELAPKLYQIGELAGQWLRNLQVRLGNTQLPLYLILKDLDVFANRYLGAAYPEGRVAALETAAWFRNALAYPVKKVRCRTAN
ncbi:MAG: hypothetical protein E7056_07880 [Lentisphaerae bacterium]|nr:hypothetical protein [Lentisphaerota bacterium]